MFPAGWKSLLRRPDLAWSSPRGALLSWQFNNGYYLLYETVTHIPVIWTKSIPTHCSAFHLIMQQIGPARKISALNFARVTDTVCVWRIFNLCNNKKKHKKKANAYDFNDYGATFISCDFLSFKLMRENSLLAVQIWLRATSTDMEAECSWWWDMGGERR